MLNKCPKCDSSRTTLATGTEIGQTMGVCLNCGHSWEVIPSGRPKNNNESEDNKSGLTKP